LHFSRASCLEPLRSVFGCWGCDGLLARASILAFWRSRGSLAYLRVYWFSGAGLLKALRV